MPKRSPGKTKSRAAAKPGGAARREKPTRKKATETVHGATGGTSVVHSCIRGCAGHDNFGPNDQLRNIPANAQCVQTCIIDATGKPVLIAETDTENDITGML